MFIGPHFTWRRCRLALAQVGVPGQQ